jgi:hypothetical protein
MRKLRRLSDGLVPVFGDAIPPHQVDVVLAKTNHCNLVGRNLDEICFAGTITRDELKRNFFFVGVRNFTKKKAVVGAFTFNDGGSVP